MSDGVTSEPQHMTALERANKVRIARSELKKAVARGEKLASEVIEENSWEAETMTLAELLTSQRRWGKTRARKFLQLLTLAESKHIVDLTVRQRCLLIDSLREKGM